MIVIDHKFFLELSHQLFDSSNLSFNKAVGPGPHDTNSGWPLVLESPGIAFSPGKVSWKTEKNEKSPGILFLM